MMASSGQQSLTVVFDIGGVLLDWNPRHLYRKVFDTEAEMERFLATVCTPAWNVEQDRGRSFAEACDLLVAAFPDFEPQIRAYDTRWAETIPSPLQNTYEILNTLKDRGDAVYAITNFSAEKWPVAVTMYPFLGRFDGVAVSGALKVMKPDHRIYAWLCETYELEPAACVFIDDNAANVEAAQAFGMKAIRFTSADALRRDLTGLGVL